MLIVNRQAKSRILQGAYNRDPTVPCSYRIDPRRLFEFYDEAIDRKLRIDWGFTWSFLYNTKE